MYLASIIVVVCGLLVPGEHDLGAIPLSQAQENPQNAPLAPFPGSIPDQAPSDETVPPKTETTAPGKKPAATSRRAKKKTPVRRRRTTAKPVVPKADGSPEKRVVRNGSATDPTTQISPSVPQQQASSQLQSTNSLLSSADTNLKSISGAQLNSSQEDMVKQIRTYMEQAKAATETGDLERANNLATKAQLLSAELVKK
jgi:hypothetical protein